MIRGGSFKLVGDIDQSIIKEGAPNMGISEGVRIDFNGHKFFASRDTYTTISTDRENLPLLLDSTDPTFNIVNFANEMGNFET